jgi:hypothetical protein
MAAFVRERVPGPTTRDGEPWHNPDYHHAAA